MSTGLEGPRAVLNELKWRFQALDEAVVHYIHRGAPGDRAVFTGGDVVDLGRSFVRLERQGERASIPYHRIFRIDRGGEAIWRREELHEEDDDRER